MTALTPMQAALQAALQLVQDFEHAVATNTEVNVAGKPAAVRRIAAAEMKRSKDALGLHIIKLYKEMAT